MNVHTTCNTSSPLPQSPGVKTLISLPSRPLRNLADDVPLGLDAWYQPTKIQGTNFNYSNGKRVVWGRVVWDAKIPK